MDKRLREKEKKQETKKTVEKKRKKFGIKPCWNTMTEGSRAGKADQSFMEDVEVVGI